MHRDLRSQTRTELEALLLEWGQPAYRVQQVLDWAYVRRATAWEDMSSLPRSLREKLAQELTLRTLELVRRQGSPDTTQKFLWRLADHSLIESVLIPASPALYGEPSDRQTLCLSTQVGCAYGCRFCASGLDGWKRHLAVEEIVEQVLAVERWHALESLRSNGTSGASQAAWHASRPAEEVGSAPRPPASADHSPVSRPRFINNLVIMGMGEPLANYENLLKALRILNASWGGRIGARKITISTSGLAPQIRRLADEPLQFRLAISLHGATDETRSRIMPINRKYPLKELMAACEHYLGKKGRQITFEYILIAGVNDSCDQIKPLAQLAHRLRAKVNLIPYNRVEGLPWERPAEEAQEAFLAALKRHKVGATLRREKGHDIDAACGQLRLKVEQRLKG